MFDDVSDLYQELILDHNRNPRNFGEMENFNHDARGHNPLCGDDMHVYLHIKDDLITDIKFSGTGCAISKASASLMTEALHNKSVANAKLLFEMFHNLVADDALSCIDEDSLGKLYIFKGVKQFPMRVKCATLAWHTLIAALNDKSKLITTEK